jgi:hypothetical protein
MSKSSTTALFLFFFRFPRTCKGSCTIQKQSNFTTDSRYSYDTHVVTRSMPWLRECFNVSLTFSSSHTSITFRITSRTRLLIVKPCRDIIFLNFIDSQTKTSIHRCTSISRTRTQSNAYVNAVLYFRMHVIIPRPCLMLHDVLSYRILRILCVRRAEKPMISS